MIFLNAETIPPLGSSPDPERVKVPGNYSKPETIEKYRQEHAVQAWEDMAKDPLQAQVFIITLLPEWEQDPIILLDRDEAALVEHFDRWIQRNCQTSAHGWVTWNGLHFDYPLLQLRGLKYGAKRVAYEMRASRYPTDRHDDLSKLFPPFTSLDAAAAFLGIPNDNPIPGSEIRRRFDADDFEAIYAHTRSRVTLLREMKKRGA